MQTNVNVKKISTLKTRKVQDIIFMAVIFAIPVLNFLVLYVGVNVNYVLLAFKSYDLESKSYFYSGFGNFAEIFKGFATDNVMSGSLFNSLTVYGIHLFFSLPLSLLISFSIYKKVFGNSVFRVVLFLPSIISSVVWVLIFKFFSESVLPDILNKPDMSSVLINPKTSFEMMIVYNIWTGLAGHMIIYLGAMSRVPVSLIEYGRLEGVGLLKEFRCITFPLIFPTVSVFLVMGVVSIFTNQLSIFTFHGERAGTETYTLGYYFFIKVFGNKSSYSEYPFAAAAGLIFTAVSVPLTFLIRWLLHRFGPNEEY